MNYLFASLMIGVSAATLTLTGLPHVSFETHCNGAAKGSIVEIANCPDMPERIKKD